MKKIFFNRLNLILIVIFLLILIGAFFLYQKIITSQLSESQNSSYEEIEISFDPEGAYALLTPRRDGNALILNIRRVASYDQFAYQLTYSDENGVERGAGFLDTWISLEQGKSDYEQELLLGSCSRNVCVYDEGVEYGTLVIRLKKGNTIYKSYIQWHLQDADLSEGMFTSGDNHFQYKISEDLKEDDLSLIGYTVVNDLTGAPKLPSDRSVVGKVYALNSLVGKDIPQGKVTIELAENPPFGSSIYRYDESKNDWEQLETNIDGSILSAQAQNKGIFAVLAPK